MHMQRALSGFLTTVISSLLACATGQAAAQENDSGRAGASGQSLGARRPRGGGTAGTEVSAPTPPREGRFPGSARDPQMTGRRDP